MLSNSYPLRDMTGVVIFSLRPSSGIFQIITLQSSEEEAIILSLNGLKSVSNTGALWPLKHGRLSWSLPVFSNGITAKEPPPPASKLTDKYLFFFFFFFWLN